MGPVSKEAKCTFFLRHNFERIVQQQSLAVQGAGTGTTREGRGNSGTSQPLEDCQWPSTQASQKWAFSSCSYHFSCYDCGGSSQRGSVHTGWHAMTEILSNLDVHLFFLLSFPDGLNPHLPSLKNEAHPTSPAIVTTVTATTARTHTRTQRAFRERHPQREIGLAWWDDGVVLFIHA